MSGKKKSDFPETPKIPKTAIGSGIAIVSAAAGFVGGMGRPDAYHNHPEQKTVEQAAADQVIASSGEEGLPHAEVIKRMASATAAEKKRREDLDGECFKKDLTIAGEVALKTAAGLTAATLATTGIAAAVRRRREKKAEESPERG